MWQRATRPLPLTSYPQKQKWVPHLSRPLRKVGTTNACSAALDVAVAFARVERTLLSIAFDVDLDLAGTRIRRGCPISRVLCEKWEPRTPAPPPLTLMLPLPVWNGHSCPLPLTLILPLTLVFDRDLDCRGWEDSYQGMPSGIPRSRHDRGRAALKRRVKQGGRSRPSGLRQRPSF